MNVHELQSDEARYLLFSIRKTLQEKANLPPTQVQFYESTERILREKIQRLDRAKGGYPDPPVRDKFATVRPSWHDVAVGSFQNYPPSDT